MNSKWDEEFDFMEEGDKKETKKKQPPKGSKMTYGNDDFGDLEDDDNGLKLPSIGGNKPTGSSSKSNKKSNQIQLEELNTKKDNNKSKASFNPYEQPQEEFQESVAPTNSPLKEREQKEKPIEPAYVPPEPKVEEEDYEEENFEAEQKYEEDFEVQQEKKTTPNILKTKQKKTMEPKGNVKVPKPQSRTRKGVESVTKKQDTSARMHSRNSARSYDRTSHSKTRVEDRKEQGPNKYVNLAEKQCPSYDQKTLEQFSLDKLTRENERARNAIKKLNDQLNDMINKNINQLKVKKVEKEVNQQDILKNLEEQRNNNEVVLQNSNRQLLKLKTKQGALREEEYHLSLDEKILEAKNGIVECGKLIPKLKFEIDSQGKRLTKIDKSDKQQLTVQISNIKMSTINTQKEFQKNEEIIAKLQSKFEELVKKVNEADSKHSKEMEEAKEKGISIITNPQMAKKAEQLRKKVDLGRNHKGKTEALYKTKTDMIVHELEQIKAQIKHLQTSTLGIHANCEQVQGQSKKVVEKASKKSNVSPELLTTLESILLEMERGGMIVSKESIEDQATFSHPKGAKKYHSVKNVDKVPVTPPLRQPQVPKNDPNLKKPQLFKKKKEDQKQDERVWKDDHTQSPKRSEKGKQSQPDLTKFQEREQKNEEKKKPFMIKKKDRSTQQKIESPKEEKKQLKAEEPKNEEIPMIAPRMKIFKRNKEEPPKEEPKVTETTNDKNVLYNKSESNNSKAEQKDEEKPTFVPKRFNLKMKDKRTEDSGYVASTLAEKKEEPKIEEQKPKEQEYKPRRFNIDKTSSKNMEIPETSPQVKPAQEEKPKFNLKLRDREKEFNKPEEKEVVKEPQQPQGKIMISLNDNPKPSKENSNPYAQPQAQEVPKREREGRIKKEKPAQNIPKQQFNIYEQAEDLSNVKSLEPEEPKLNYAKAPPKEEDLDLNKMLGIDKKKSEGFDDLLGDGKPQGRGPKKEKKETNFFGDLQL